MHTVYLSLGSNLGDRRKTIEASVSLIDERVGKVAACSSLIETEPWGFSSANKFLNACVCCHTELSPRQLLEATQGIERMLGRTEKSVGGHYRDRTIDIDILLYDDITIDEPDLKIPHPHIADRDFVKIPLSEIRAD